METHVGIVNLERRKHPRFEVDLPVEYYKTDSSIGHTSQLMNTSEGGLLVFLPEQMKIGQHLGMKLFLSFGADLNIIEILTEVVWRDIHLEKGWGNYRFGVRFVDISPNDLNTLKKFLMGLTE